MKTGWPTVPIADLCLRVTSGGTPSRANPGYYDGGTIPWIKTGELRGWYVDTIAERITPAAIEASSAKVFPRETVLLAMYGDGKTMGSVGLVGAPAATNQACCAMLANPEKCDPKFLLYSLIYFKPALLKLAISGAQRNLNSRTIKQFPIGAPPLAIQRRIASILGAYDDLIEVNRRRIAVLEEMARRLFEEWFVLRGAPGNAPKTEAAADWQDVAVGDAMRFVRGRSYRSAELADSGGLPFVNLKCIQRDGGFRRDGVKRYVGEYKDEQALRAGDIVMAVTDMTQDRRIVGQAARVPRSDEPLSVMSMDLVKVVPSMSLEPLFCYYWLRYSGFASSAAQHANGANVLHLSPAAVVGLPIALPPLALQRRFCRVAQLVADQCEILSMGNERLAASRDLLLPRLISGDLSVATAERELKSVV